MICLKSTTSKCELRISASTAVKSLEKWNTYTVLNPFSNSKENQDINNPLKVINFLTDLILKDFNWTIKKMGRIKKTRACIAWFKISPLDVWIQNAGPSSNHHCKDSWRCQRNINGEILWSLTGIPSWLMVSHESVMKTWCVTYSCTASHGCGHFQKLRPWTEVRLALSARSEWS